jgi:hypothetical protein
MWKKTVGLIICVIVIAGCSLVAPTGDSKDDSQAAQNFIPEIAGYNKSDANNIVDAISSLSGGASLLSGNALLAGAVAKIDDMINCYQEVGAVTAQIYTQKTFDITNLDVPAAGVLAIINQDRLKDNFLSCALSTTAEGFSAQGVTLEPCVGSGEFKAGDETISYLYAATAPVLCDLYEQHFESVRQSLQ